MPEQKPIEEMTKAELVDTIFDCVKQLKELEADDPNVKWVIPACTCGMGNGVPHHKHSQSCPVWIFINAVRPYNA